MKPHSLFNKYVLTITLCIGTGFGFSAFAGSINFEANSTSEIILLAAAKTDTPKQPRTNFGQSSKLVKSIQEGLSKQGYFLGSIDGVYGPETERAIRAYQKSSGLPVDGKPSESLASNLETGGKVGELLKKLELAQKKSMKKAELALLSRPETRNLIQGKIDDISTAKHNWDECIKKPTPRCLLIEASIAVKEIEKPEMRNWALGEILVAQAKAGLAKDAMNSTRLIHDPQLIIVALRNIAKSQAGAGRHAEAMEAVDIIPDINSQIEAYISITEIMARRGETKLSGETAEHLLEFLGKVKDPLTKVNIRSRLAVIFYGSGEKARSKKNMDNALYIARKINDVHLREKAMRHVASAMAETGEPERALELIKGAKNGAGDVPVLMAAATGHALSGKTDVALSTADAIEAVRYRALVLSKIAAYQAGAGMTSDAGDTLEKATEAAKTIRFPFAKAYAFSRIALSYNDVGISAGDDENLLNKSLDMADLVSDSRLRAHIIWAISDERKRAQSKYFDVAHEKAIDATSDIKSSLSRVWMLCDVAETRAGKGDLEGAWSLYDEAKTEALQIIHPWGRSRALAKVAITLTDLASKTTDE
ncbi:MAG: peptidoglycan-binding protein [Rhodospirillaceae bacterium]|nr:peptidoglycan-binding protein [Rhodospirillaceae bacterium]